MGVQVAGIRGNLPAGPGRKGEHRVLPLEFDLGDEEPLVLPAEDVDHPFPPPEGKGVPVLLQGR